MHTPTRSLRRAALVIVALAAIAVPGGAAAAATANSVDAPPTAAPAAAGVAASSASSDTLSSASPVLQRSAPSSCSPTTYHKVYSNHSVPGEFSLKACAVQSGSSTVQANARINWYRPYDAYLASPPEFYWFKVKTRLVASTGAVISGECSHTPRRSTANVTSTERAFISWNDHAFTCYFDRPATRGTFYNVTMQLIYDVKGDGKYTLTSPVVSSPYVRY